MTASSPPLIKPPRAAAGTKVGVVAPAESASVIRPDHWERAVSWFAARGLDVIAGRAAFERRPSGIERARDLMNMFSRPDVSLIAAAVGGYTSHDLLDHLDYELIASHPKILVGFSDITALSAAIHAKTGLVTVCGPVFGTFCQPELSSFTEESFSALALRGDATLSLRESERWADDDWLESADGKRAWKMNPGWTIVRPGQAEGRSVAGNLSTLLLLAGTTYMPSFDGAILFLEDDEEVTPSTLARALRQLDHLGAYDRIAGLLFGRFSSRTPWAKGGELKAMIAEAVGPRRFPIVLGLDFGHTDPLASLPLGIRCRIDTERREVRFLEAAVCDPG